MRSPLQWPVLDRVTALLLAAMAAACFLFALGKGFTVDPLRAVPAVVVLGGLALARAVALGRRRERGAAVATAFLQMTGFTVLGVVLAYAIAAHAPPLFDDQLAAADRTLGFDWPAVLARLDTSPPLIWVLGLAYHSLCLQMVVAILLLGLAGRLGTLRVLVAAAVLSGFVTILVSAVVPAMGNLFDPGRYLHLWPSIAWLEQDLVTGLRDGTARRLDLSMLMGIVSFPSFHATLAALFAWAARDVGRWRAPLRVWAGLTIIATPVFGGHYAVEVIAGLLLAPLALASVRGLERRLALPSRIAATYVRVAPSRPLLARRASRHARAMLRVRER